MFRLLERVIEWSQVKVASGCGSDGDNDDDGGDDIDYDDG